MTHFKGTGMIHLDINDFDLNTNTLMYNKQPVKGKWICMVQGNFCGFCTQAKPAFLEAKNKCNTAFFCTIQIDGTNEAQVLGKQLSTITNIPMGGVPGFILFKDGKPVKKFEGERTSKALIEFINTN